MLQEECKEKILSEEYRDFMMRDTGALGENFPLENGCRIPLKYGFELLYIDQSEDRKKPLGDYPYTMVPKCYTTLDMAAIQQAGIAAVQNLPGLELSGEGVLVGIIDTGINYLDPIFRNLDGSTRIRRIWDQEEQSGTAPREIGYGSEYTREQINLAIQSENPKETVPSFDTDGHGTFVASVACGGANPENLFIGAAPEAEMVIVKLKEAKEYLREYYFVDCDARCYQENDLVAAVFYLQKVQEELKRPLVICLAVGTSLGGHGGYSILSEYLRNVAASEGIGIVTGSGNEADKRHHYLGILEQENNQPVEINVGNNTRGFVMELWTELPNLLALSIESPTGQTIGPVSLRRGIGEYVFVLEQTRVILNYRVLVETTGAQLVFFQFDRPGSGIWKIIPETLELGNGIFHIWLPMEEFLTGNVYFIRANPEYTVMEPGDTGPVVCAAYYNGKENSIAVSSGRGYTRDNRIKPDFAAPGINVTGINLRGQFVARSGSSIAVGITSGALALFMEWLDRQGVDLDASQMKNLLILGASRKTDMSYPNQEWGYGALNLYRTFEQIRRF
ncbi:MAG: peptidase [Coprococcus comes]|nr:peptidase [Coprococcus comes]